MNPIHPIISQLRNEIGEVFQQLSLIILENEDIMKIKTGHGEWTIQQILEHVSLANHYLLKLIRKGSVKAVRKRKHMDLEKELMGYDFNNPNMDVIADSKFFKWESPAHMIPRGASAEEILDRFSLQRKSLADLLANLENGEGILHKTTMSVYQLGKLDVYQYMHFLLLHAKRHIEHIKKIKKNFHSSQ